MLGSEIQFVTAVLPFLLCLLSTLLIAINISRYSSDLFEQRTETLSEEPDDGLWQGQKGRECSENVFWKTEQRYVTTDTQASKNEEAERQQRRMGRNSSKLFYHYGNGF